MMTSEVASAQKKRVLIVEDDGAILAILEEAMIQEGYIVKASTSAREAMELVKSFQPHIVLTDNDMPDITGIEMLKELRRLKNYVTVIFISGRTDSQFVVQPVLATLVPPRAGLIGGVEVERRLDQPSVVDALDPVEDE
ncbi:MAG: response regulator, partial [Bdellovibrionales bacterium]|nr:response regulator [Bdellovibrionales bacterium]